MVLGLACITLAVFARVVSHDFVLWDDDRNIYANPLILSGAIEHLPEFWKGPFLGMYIPVTYTVWVILALASQNILRPGAGGSAAIDPALFHLANVALHLGCALLVLALIYRLLDRKDFLAAALGAALFAIHPLQAEPVAWATGMKDLLGTFLALASMLCYLHGRGRTGDPPQNAAASSLGYGFSLVFFTAALLAKPSLVVVPLLLIVFESGFLGVPWKRSLLAALPFFGIALAATAVTVVIQRDPALFFAPEEVVLWKRPLIALDSLSFYITKLVYPVSLGADYGRTPSQALALNKEFPVCIIPLLAAIILAATRRRRFYLTAAAAGAIALAPVLGLAPFAFQGISTVADRYAYLALFPAGLLLAGWLTIQKSRRTCYGVVAVALAALAAITSEQVSHWKDTRTLFTHSLSVNPDSTIAHYTLGLELSHLGMPDEAAQHYRTAIQLRPDFPYPYVNLGHLLNRKQQHGEAIPYLEKAIELQPGNAEAYCNLGVSLSQAGRSADAAECYARALRITPHDPEVMIDLAYARANSGRFEDAIPLLLEAIRLAPEITHPYRCLGAIYMAQQRFDEAARHFETLTRLQWTNPWAYTLLAEAYARSGDVPRAVDSAERALQLARRLPDFPGDLAHKIENDYTRYLGLRDS